MDVSIFLAKTIGTYFLIICVSMFLNARFIKNIIEDVNSNSLLFFLTGLIVLILGILIVVSHNIWVNDWRIVITIIGWLILLKGMFKVVFPEFAYRPMFSFLYTNTAYYVASFIILILGAFLSYIGFSSQML